LELTTGQSRELQRLIQAPATPQKIVRRARIVALAAQGRDNDEIAAALAPQTPDLGGVNK
jgi:hypothetical protein